MFDLYKNIQTLCEERGISISRMSVEIGMSKSLLSNLKNGRTDSISKRTAQKIADYLDVPVDVVLHGKKTEPAEKRTLSEDDIKYAFFGGDAGIMTEEDMEDVRKVAAILIERRKRGQA